MHTTSINPATLSAAAASIPPNTPILMLNLLRFKPQASYTSHPDHPALPPCTGREAYLQRYVPAFNAIVAKDLDEGATQGIRVTFLGAAVADCLVGPSDSERWDIVALVRYPSFAAFRKVAEGPEYRATAERHRLAALEDARLIATVEMAVD